MSSPSIPATATPRRKSRWRGMTVAGILVAIFAGMAIGQGLYTFRYGEGLSYFSTNPKACANCHVMQSYYDGWQKASHHTSATCVDCHLPHEFVPKYLAKAENGFWHSKGFTLQDFPEPIVMREKSQHILQHSCLHCHANFVHDVLSARPEQEELNCIHCHRTVGHGDKVGVGRYEPLTQADKKTWGPHEQRP